MNHEDKKLSHIRKKRIKRKVKKVDKMKSIFNRMISEKKKKVLTK